MAGVLRETGVTAPADPDTAEAEDEATQTPSDADGVTRTPLIGTTSSGSTLEIGPGLGGGTGEGLFYTDLNNAGRLRDALTPRHGPGRYCVPARRPPPVCVPRWRRVPVG